MMKIEKISLIGFLLLSLFVFQTAASLESSKSTYRGMLSKLSGDFKSEHERAKGQYYKNLNLLKGMMQSKGDLDNFLSVQEEVNRFSSAKNVPTLSESESPPIVLAIQEIFWRSVGDAEKEKNKKHTVLANKFKSHLASMQKELTKKGKIDEAIKVRKEIADIDEELEGMGSMSVTGVEVKIQKCSACSGTGKMAAACPRCRGQKNCLGCAGAGRKVKLGQMMKCVQCMGSGKCRDCNGSGSVSTADCSACKGKGEIEIVTQIAKNSVEPDEPVESGESAVVSIKAPPQIIKSTTSSASMDDWFKSYVETTGKLYSAFKNNEAKSVDFKKFISSPDDYEGELLTSEVYLSSAFARSVVASAGSGGKKAGLMPYSLSVGRKATAVFKSAGGSKKVRITYGVVSKDNVTLFDAETL